MYVCSWQRHASYQAVPWQFLVLTKIWINISCNVSDIGSYYYHINLRYLMSVNTCYRNHSPWKQRIVFSLHCNEIMMSRLLHLTNLSSLARWASYFGMQLSGEWECLPPENPPHTEFRLSRTGPSFFSSDKSYQWVAAVLFIRSSRTRYESVDGIDIFLVGYTSSKGQDKNTYLSYGFLFCRSFPRISIATPDFDRSEQA